MGKKRQRRAGPKSSKSAKESKDEEEVEESPTKKSSAVEEIPSVSSPVEEESEKASAETEHTDSDKQQSDGPKILNEVDGTLIDAPLEDATNEKDKESEKEKANDEPEAEVEAEVEAEPIEAKPVMKLRLVPLTMLLKPALLEAPAKPATSKASPRKFAARSRKSTSYIEISSDSGEDAEQISIGSTTSESSNDDDDDATRKRSPSKRKRDAGSSKENNSTNNKLSNGTGHRSNFKEPMSPSKIMKNSKDFSVNLEKMPNNVNKLMKCYRLSEEKESSGTRIESWSETDDFENMIVTSKIDRVALDKVKTIEPVVEKPVDKLVEKKRGRQSKKDSDDDSAVAKKKSKKLNSDDDEDRPKRPERNSARNAKLRTKTAIETDEKSSSSESEEEPKKPPARRTRRAVAPSDDSESDAEPLGKKKRAAESKKKPAESESSSSEEKKLFKKKKAPKDDHAKEKLKPKRREKSSSSEEEEKEVPARGRANKSKETAPPRSTRSRREVAKEPEKKTTRGKVRANDLKITINLNKSAVIGRPNDDDSDGESKKKDSDESSMTDDEKLLQPVKLTPKKEKRVKSTSESEVGSSSGVEVQPEVAVSGSETEISEHEKMPILDQKLRNRNKFEKNSAFNTLKQKIEQRKSKLKVSEDDEPKKESTPRTSRRNQKNGDLKESNNNDDKKKASPAVDDEEATELSIATKKLAAKRKRLLSSSEDEQEKNGEVEMSAKKKKMSAKDDDDYESVSGDEKMKEETDEDKSEKDEDDDEDDDDEKSEKDDNSSSDDEQPKKRKPKNSSDESNPDSDDIDGLEKDRPKNKRRKRIKKIASSDEEGGENGDKKSGRKNIRKLLRADKLDVSTKEAAKIERERKQRIEERQNIYNQFYDERPEEAKEITKLVLDFDEKTKKPLLQVDKKLVRKLKPHQANGVKFMWDACFESLERCEKDLGSGCILAHCMGLGKTLQVITLVHTLLKNTDDTGVLRVLVVCPLSTVLNWVNEFNIWLKDIEGREDIYVYEINKLKQNVDRANKLMEWHNDGGIMILSYDMFRNLTNDTGSRFRKKIKDSLQTSLIDPGPDLVICDEGHLLKNEKTSISKAMMRLRTLRRIVLTGTPLQNNLKEYYCMVQFVKPNLLGKYQEYMNRFVNPITNGQYTDSTDYDIQVMRRRAHVLHKLLDGCVQRRDYSVLAPFLPPKHEYVISIKLTPMQVKLYKHYMENKSKSNDENGGRKGSILFQDFQNLQRIWTAPLVLRYNSNRYEQEMQRRKDLESEDESEGSLKDFIDDSESAASTSSESSGDDSDEDATSIHSDDPKKSKKKKKKQKGPALPRRTRAMAAEIPSDHEADEIAATAAKKDNPTEWWMQICPEEELNNLEHSSKLMLLMSILEECEAIGDKLLVFSQSLYSLDVIEHFLNHIDEQTQQNSACASFTGSWTLGQDYFRLDGSTPVEQRNASCKHFNSPSNPRARLFLISTRAGGLGINLVAANRVIIFDVSWNPSHDIQSIFRVYRFGQNKPCYIYRFLAMGTMEEKIYERQVTKQAISKRVIDEQQIDRHYNQNDLQELYRYDLEPDDERILPILPKDRLFAEMLKKFEDMIYKYHEHDTLLENKEEETLDEDERKQAWEEFEAEKNRPQFVAQPYMPQQPRGLGPVTSNNIFGIRTDVLLKLLSMKARLDHPYMTDVSVKQAIPVLMQELYRQMDRGELTLYQQLLALSSSLEVPTNYGGQFRVNENMMQQTYNSMNAMPSTSSLSGQSSMYRQQMAERQQQFLKLAQQQQQQQRQQLLAQQLRQRSPPRVVGSVIEID